MVIGNSGFTCFSRDHYVLSTTGSPDQSCTDQALYVDASFREIPDPPDRAYNARYLRAERTQFQGNSESPLALEAARSRRVRSARNEANFPHPFEIQYLV